METDQMREIEIKVKLSDSKEVQKKLVSLGFILGKPIKQHDVVYGQRSGEKFIQGNWLRIRIEDETRVIFNLKRSISGQLDSVEHEVEVDNEQEMRSIIGRLGYELYSDLTKIRRKAKYNNIEICLDEVPGLGNYLEAEILADENVDGDVVKEQLWNLFEDLGLKKSDEVHDGYDVLMRRKEGKGHLTDKL